MEGKRFRHTLWPTYNIGGLIQFEDGYWPSLSQPPCTDPGLCSYVERAPNFGTLLFECDETLNPIQDKEALTRDDAALVARAEEVLRKMKIRPPKAEAPPPPPPPPEVEALSADSDRLPTPGEVKRLNKTDITRLAERLGIADQKFLNATRPEQIKAVLAEIAAIEE